MTRNELADLYNIDRRTLYNYCRPFKRKLAALATKIIRSESLVERKRSKTRKGKYIVRKRLNRRQVKFIINRIMQDPPEGYIVKGGVLIKITDNDEN